MEKQPEVKLTAAEKAEQKFLASTFKSQLTEQGLEELRQRFPADVVLDMTDEATFKQARKDRTERNKLTEAINRRRIDFTNDLKAHGDHLVGEVNAIFDTVVIPFEKEDQRRKDEAARIKREHEEMLNGQRSQLADIKGFIDTAKETDDTDIISGLIDAVNNIEADAFHKDIIHEVMETLKTVSKELTEIFMQKAEASRLKAEAEAAEAARLQAEAEAAEAKRIAEEEAAEAKRVAEAEAAEAKRISDEKIAAEEAKGRVSGRLNTLQMIPLDLMGEPAKKIRSKIAALNNYEIPEADFGDRYEEAIIAKKSVIERLDKMLTQAEQLEAFEAEKAAQQAALTPDPIIEPEMSQEYQQHEPPQQTKTIDPQEVLDSMSKASDLLPENQQQAPVEQAPKTLIQDLEAWYFQFGITEEAYSEMINILSSHEVQL